MGEAPLLIVAGEASGDLHAARLLEAMRSQGFSAPAFGLGGEQLEAAGMELVARSAEISVVGIAEAMKILPRARRIFHQLLGEVECRRARAAILVDFPDFNLRLAKKLARRGVKVVYYVSPQVWAWRRGRVRIIAEVVDRMLVLFPFEVEFYRRHRVEAIHVGHPLVDEVPVLPQIWDAGSEPARPFHVALLPGSRRSEVEVLLPILLESARLLARQLPVRFSLIRAAAVPPEEIDDQVAGVRVDLTVVAAHRFRALASCHLALCAAGTATLELGLLGTPMVVTHRVSVWSYLIGRLLVDLPHASLVNLILEREVVPELLQGEARPAMIAEEARRLLTSPEKIGVMRAALAELRGRIGPPGASSRAAEEVRRVLATPR